MSGRGAGLGVPPGDLEAAAAPSRETARETARETRRQAGPALSGKPLSGKCLAAQPDARARRLFAATYAATGSLAAAARAACLGPAQARRLRARLFPAGTACASAQNTPGKDMPGKDMPAQDMPAQDMPAQDMPGKPDQPVQAAQERPVRREAAPEARARVRQAEALARRARALEAEALRRALRGVSVPVFHQGREVGRTVKHSDSLLMFLLRALVPERYGRAAEKAEDGGERDGGEAGAELFTVGLRLDFSEVDGDSAP